MYYYLVQKLYIAVLEGDIQQLKKLTKLGANVNHVFSNHGDTLLHYAPNAETATFLLLNMAKSNVKDRYGQTPLCCAAAKPNCVEVAKVLLDAGADVNVKMLNGKTPLHYAPNLEMTQLLLKYGAQVNAKDKYDRTPLHAAILDKKGIDVFRCLLEAGADINAKMGELKNTVLHLADSVDIVREILSRKFDINAVTTKKQTALHQAVKGKKDLSVIRELLMRGINVDIKDSKNDMAIYFAVRNKKRDHAVIQLLVEYGSINEDLFQDTYLNRQANCLGYTISRDKKLCMLICRFHLLRLNGNVDKMPYIGTDACGKADRDFMLDYIKKCGQEIVNLKKYNIVGNYSLYDILMNKKVIMIPLKKSYRQLEQEMSEKFPYYHEAILVKIRPYLERARLLNRLRFLRISVKNDKEKFITINPNCTSLIIRMLPNDSLWNVIIASELK